MAQFNLQGYLLLKSSGGLSILKPPRKLWLVYRNENCQLFCYKNEFGSENGCKAPLEIINLQKAAITPHAEENNRFIIYSEQKEYHLFADDYESMMRWIIDLQRRRDEWNNQFNTAPIRSDYEDTNFENRNEMLPNKEEMQIVLHNTKRAEERCEIRANFCFSDYSSGQLGSYKFNKSRSSTSLPQEEDDDTTSDERQRINSAPEIQTETIPKVLEESNITYFHPEEECDGSISSDSAVCTSDYHSAKIQEMEAEMRMTHKILSEALCREAAYKSTMERLEDLVEELEDRMSRLQGGVGFWRYLSGDKTLVNFRKLEEKCQILKNHNIFLNDEILKLIRMLQQEQFRFQTKEVQIQDIKNQIEQMKRDYVFLFLSSIRIFYGDGPETTEVYLYGGSRHKVRVLSLLEEARKINKDLPTYDCLIKPCYVDPMGFEYCFTEESVVLHYICSLLYTHYSKQLRSYEKHVNAWNKYCKQGEKLCIKKEVKFLVRKGVPDHLRKTVWRQFYRDKVQDIIKEKGPYYYKTLVNTVTESQIILYHNRQIALDLLRTMPNNTRFSTPKSEGVIKLEEVLLAFCLHNPYLGYCQGMNFLVGMCLLIFEPEDAFWCLVAITEKFFPATYFDQSLIGAQADQEVLKDLIKEKLPNLYRHLSTLDIDLRTVTLNWFMSIFFDCVPFETLLRIWDCFLLEGPKVLFRFTLAILKMQEEAILKKKDTVSVMRQLKACAKFCYNVDDLVKVAFEDFHPFPRRSDLATKQTYYAKMLKDSSKKRERRRKSFADMLPEMMIDWKLSATSRPCIDCATVYDNNKLWLAYCHTNGSQMIKINAEDCIMYKLNIECESRIICMHSATSDILLLGTVSSVVQMYDNKNGRLLSEVKLSDSVLCLHYRNKEEINVIYAGLADGTLGVIENIYETGKKKEVFYISIGSSPVSCLLELDWRLLCACGNRIFILNSRTLDTLNQLQITCNDMDHISNLVWNGDNIWTSVRGSSILHVWDSHTLACKLIFDVKHNRPTCHSSKEDDSFLQPMHINAILPIDNGVIVGTSDGSLLIYDVEKKISRSISYTGSSIYESVGENIEDEAGPLDRSENF
ncbi:TBC1 domain family member 2A-like isoform X1 [Centruroides vittatus]|uniref:TBC1 domain family member 2A-like isoform X1 n=2 Tax=Centruroides vittatus TaxID=120091 RepID=UPI00350F87E8